MHPLFGSTKRRKTRVVEPPLQYLDFSTTRIYEETPRTPAGREMLCYPTPTLYMPIPNQPVPPTSQLLKDIELDKTQVDDSPDWDYQQAYTILENRETIVAINRTMETLHTQLKKLALKEDLLALRRDIEQLQQQRVIDRNEQLAQVEYHQLQEQEILRHICLLQDKLHQFIKSKKKLKQRRRVPQYYDNNNHMKHDLLAYPYYYDDYNRYSFAEEHPYYYFVQ